MRLKRWSLGRTFALLSLLIIGLITVAQAVLQWTLLRADLLEWERTVSADTIRREAYAGLRPADFAGWRTPEAQERFERILRRPLLQLEVLRVKVYDTDARVVWSDEPRLIGSRFPDNEHLAEALGGVTVAHLERARQAENLYERQFKETVELYVPLTFPGTGTPGTATVAGVVEVYKNPSRVLAGLSRDRWTIVATSLGGGVVLYAVLFGIVRRASRQLLAQRADLERQTAALRATNRELREVQEQLRASARMAAIGEVSAAVAHGIRNPLANIRAAAQVAGEAPGDRDSVERYLAAITSEVDRLGRWLRGLLDSVRPFEPQLASVSPNEIVGDVVTLLRERIARSGVELNLALAPALPVLEADEVQLQQALLGVVENALDAMPEGGTLTVRTERSETAAGPGVRVTIQDTGEGMPPDRLARVFDAFFTTKARGTGLGLAITRRIVVAHHGTVDVSSAPAHGTIFTIVLPARGVATEVA